MRDIIIVEFTILEAIYKFIGNLKNLNKLCKESNNFW